MDDLEPVSARDGFDKQEVDIAVYWSKTIDRCNAVAGWGLDSSKSVITKDDIRSRLMPKSTERPEIFLKAIRGFEMALSVVNTLGSIVGSAAGTVIGPANQAANAISFVVGAIQNYNAVIAEIGDLMERLAAFLERIDLYIKQGMNPALNVTVYQVMDHFLYIMAAVYHLRGNWKNRLIMAAKTTILGKDQTIKNAAKRFEELVDRHTHRQMDIMSHQIYTDGIKLGEVDRKIDGIAEGTGYIRNAIDKATEETGRKERHKKITDGLNIDPSSKPWLERQEQHWAKARAPDTGKWLSELSAFTQWCDLESDHRLLCIQASAGYGKSVLTSYIVRQLQLQYRERPSVFVTCYYIQQGSDNAVNLAMRSIIYQMAVLQESSSATKYSKYVEKSLKADPDISNTAKLWKTFIAETAKGQSIDGTLFIIVDGLDEIELNDVGKAGIDELKSIVKTISSSNKDSKGLQVHLCLSAREEGLKAVDAMTQTRIILGLPDDAKAEDNYANKADLDSYIQFRLASMDIFKVRKNEEVSQVMTELESTLAQSVRGDYSKLSLLLDLIEKSISIEDIREVAKRANDTQDEIIRAQIKTLNVRLSKSEIAEVNELLFWASYAVGTLTVNQYQDLLTQDQPRKVLIDLRKQIKDRYTMLKVDENDGVLLRFSEWFAKYKDEDAGELFEKGEVNLVQRLLRTHFHHISGDDELYRKYNFDEYFKSLQGSDSIGIHINITPDPMHLARMCIAAIRANADNDFVKYARRNFIIHLGDCEQDNSTASKAITDDLNAVLADTVLIEAWLEPEAEDETELWRKKELRPLVMWLKGIANVDGRLQRGYSDSFEPDEAASVGSIARCIARHWLALGKKWDVALKWLQDYVKEAQFELPSGVAGVALWTKANTEYNPGPWNKCLAQSFLEQWSWKQALKRYKMALELAPDDLQCQWGLAIAHSRRKEWKEAIVCLTKLSAEILADETAQCEVKLDEVHRDLVWCYTKAGQYDEQAIRILDERFTASFTKPNATVNAWGLAASALVEVLFKLRRWRDIFQLLGRLGDEDKLVGFLAWNGADDVFHGRLQLAAAEVGITEDLAEIYEDALAFEPAQSWQTQCLRASIGLARWPGSSASQKEEIISLWEQNLKVTCTDEYANEITASSLAVAYVGRARASGWQDDVVKLSAQKLKELSSRFHLIFTKDATLLLGRMYHLMGDDEKARDCLRAYMKEGLDLMQDRSERRTALERIGSALQVMDDDINAIAAWQMIRPNDPDEVQNGSVVDNLNKDGGRTDDSQDQADMTDHDSNASVQDVTDDSWLELASEDGDTQWHRVGYSYCNGPCYQPWSYIGQVGDIFSCKDCLDTQFEQQCYEGLKTSELYCGGTCSPEHKHLRIPSINVEQLRDTGDNQLWVGGKLMHKEQWVEDLKVAWQLDDKSIRKAQAKAKAMIVRSMRRSKTGSTKPKDSEDGESKSD